MKRLAALIAVCLSLFIAPVFAQYDSERITDYKSDITVARNGVLNVTETIAVIAAGDRIRHGIFRDFPTTYTDKYDRTVVGLLTEGHLLRRYAEELEKARRDLSGEASL